MEESFRFLYRELSRRRRCTHTVPPERCYTTFSDETAAFICSIALLR